jgi:hypothetical protein
MSDTEHRISNDDEVNGQRQGADAVTASPVVFFVRVIRAISGFAVSSSIGVLTKAARLPALNGVQ